MCSLTLLYPDSCSTLSCINRIHFRALHRDFHLLEPDSFLSVTQTETFACLWRNSCSVCVYCYVVKKVAVGQPSSCITLMDHGIIYATDRFYVISFNGFTVTGRHCISIIKFELLFWLLPDSTVDFSCIDYRHVTVCIIILIIATNKIATYLWL